MVKRSDNFAVPAIPSKRARHDNVVANYAGPSVRRYSSLQAPIMQLTGHGADVYTAQFGPDGTLLASAGFDRSIFLWNVYGDCENFAVLRGHSGVVQEVRFSTDGTQLFSCSTDKNIRVWDMETGTCSRRWRNHQAFVNAICPVRRGPQLVCSASDDGTIKVWDIRQKNEVQSYQNVYQATAITWNDTADQIISGGIINFTANTRLKTFANTSSQTEL